ncbi:phenol 2-monooxygenase P1 subunit [Sphaerotilus hippei]|uniref:Phenol 2-monooxygenase P1 subunit n=1 Tax=Sphaerotilus hippei TaxID=744406 RepID=A0A318GUE2_9BURK|nr:aromatic/alkene monooxygenase hydroxylase subunit beta [Sphaerotilus hippei]PXW92301.1 phenol 2-monooxygenase P1 subunit [Sphaerotilus hippei]
MTVEIRVQNVKPLRHTFGHIARRFGDKPASRYQEGTYHLQAETNFHYKPLWDPEHDIWDPRRTAVQMADWYALKDPRQYYYGSYTIARARQQEATDRQLEMVEQRGLLSSLPQDTKDRLVRCLLPLRHFEWGANTSMSQVAAYGWGTAITQAATLAMMDRLGLAQHVSRIGLLLDGNTGTALTRAKAAWMDDAAWQGLRREVENTLVVRDWFESFVAQAVVADRLVHPLLLKSFEADFAESHGPVLASVLDFPLRWQDETDRWVDAVLKTCVAESGHNRVLIAGWVTKWQRAFEHGLLALAETALPRNGRAALQQASQALDERLARLGLQRD